MRKVSSILLKIIAGFFFYSVALLGFVSEPPTAVKLAIMFGFSIPGIGALIGGLALTQFQDWKRDAGVVFLCASGFTAFLVLTVACMLTTEEVRKMMKPDTFTFFRSYWTGGGVIVGLAVLGWILVKANKGSIENGVATNSGTGSLHS